MSPLTIFRFFNVLLLVLLCGMSVTEKARYLITERPDLTYWNPKYFTYFNVSCVRYGRWDPVYYLSAHFNARWVCNNNLSVEVYFHQFLSNRYQRSFVEFHFKVCDIITKDTFFGTDLQQGRLGLGCPIPPGPFDLYNMSVPSKNIPANFPFTKGRIFLNMTSTDNDDLVMSGHIDMEIKELPVKKRKPRSFS